MGTLKGEDGSKIAFLVQEYMNGGTLKSLVYEQMRLPRKRLYSNKDALRWLISIAKGLAYLHGAHPMVG